MSVAQGHRVESLGRVLAGSPRARDLGEELPLPRIDWAPRQRVVRVRRRRRGRAGRRLPKTEEVELQIHTRTTIACLSAVGNAAPGLPRPRTATCDDYLALPDDQEAELIVGVLYLVSGPKGRHVRVTSVLGAALGMRDGPSGDGPQGRQPPARPPPPIAIDARKPAATNAPSLVGAFASDTPLDAAPRRGSRHGPDTAILAAPARFSRAATPPRPRAGVADPA